jgi:hypothetical protein
MDQNRAALNHGNGSNIYQHLPPGTKTPIFRLGKDSQLHNKQVDEKCVALKMTVVPTHKKITSRPRSAPAWS